MKKPARLLSIAGSDSSGGAGIQADIKTASALGVYAMTALTAVTAQNTTGVGAIELLPPWFVAEQIRRCLADIGADAIKIGMLGSPAIAHAVAQTLHELAEGVPVVVDPVMVATSGAHLAEDGVAQALKTDLFPRATLVTPNLPEAAQLCGFELSTADDTARAGAMLLAMGPQSVLIKGGHATGAAVTDTLFRLHHPPESFSLPRIDTRHTHGTGCTLSTAIACGLGEGMDLVAAVERARAFVHRAIATAPGFGHGHGPLNHLP